MNVPDDTVPPLAGVTVKPIVMVAVLLVTSTDPAAPMLLPNAVTTPVPVVVVAGATPAPPPRTIAFAASAADDAHVDELLKYGMPPDVPATVRAGVVVAVATEIRPPVKLTDVTVPVPPTDTQLRTPEPFVDNTYPFVPLSTGKVSVVAAVAEFEDWIVAAKAPAAVFASVSVPRVVCCTPSVGLTVIDGTPDELALSMPPLAVASPASTFADDEYSN